MKTMLHQFDRFLTTYIHAWPAWLKPIMVGASGLAHPIPVVGIAAMLILVGVNAPISVEIFGWVVLITFGLNAVIKLMLRRKRPVTYVVKRWFATFSFPSGHTTGATVAYGALLYLSLQLAFFTPLATIIAATGLGACILLAGISRVYLGAHHPSDVVAGWLFGGVGLLAGAVLAMILS